MDNRPRGREKNVTGQGKDIYKRGDGLGTGPVGGQSQAGRTEQNASGQRGSGTARASGGSKLPLILVIAVLLLGGGGGGLLSGLLGGGSGDSGAVLPSVTQSVSSGGSGILSGSQSGSSGGQSMSASLSSLLGSFGSVSSGWTGAENTGRLDTTVASGARAKYTTIKGGGKDTVTLMVYMCGTDLESKYSMATYDLTEMANATLSDKVNIIVYTGGCRQWKTSQISNSNNQIWRVEKGAIRLLENNRGSAAMTNPDTLVDFLQYCKDNKLVSDRNMLIFWDHGGGSLSGYGYDEKNTSAGSMSLAGINTALKKANLKFDFIGFDACLMATLENALMLTDYADYLIASEETEPGVGWYYTDWLTKLSANTSMSTLEIGKNIVDDFVRVCNQQCAGQGTTLSVVDLAELEATVPAKFKAFASDTANMLQTNEYKTVSNARSGAREFAASSKIDQVDLIHLAYNLGTSESQELAEALLSAVKYNRTSSAMTNAYGRSIYFPYQKTSKVKSAAATYNAIGMDDEYTRCIQQFANLGAAGQAVSSSTSSYASNPLASLMGTASSSGSASSDMISELLTSLLTSSLSGRELDVDRAAEYIAMNQFDAGSLVWSNGVLALSESQWNMINDLELNVFFDDGAGYIDLGLDNVFDFTDEGYLVGEYDGTWLAIDGQPVAYYHTGTVDDGTNYTISGYVPILLNGERAELLLTFDNANPKGFVSGVRMVYDESETETIAKAVTELQAGDAIDFVCDYYSYGGEYLDSYRFGDPYVWTGNATISNVYIDAASAVATYRLTDIYGQNYWTPAIP